MSKPCIIAIGGPTCSGKSLLSNSLADNLTDAAVISMDSYYRDLTKVDSAELESWNFDHPASLDYNLLVEDISRLAAGRSILKPIYRYPSHTRAAEGIEVIPGAYIILDGLYALYWEAVLDYCQLKVFVSVPDAVCLQRRLRRDPVERGFTTDYIEMQYQETVRPMYQKYVHYTRERADLILNGEDEIKLSVESILNMLAKIGK